MGRWKTFMQMGLWDDGRAFMIYLEGFVTLPKGYVRDWGGV